MPELAHETTGVQQKVLCDRIAGRIQLRRVLNCAATKINLAHAAAPIPPIPPIALSRVRAEVPTNETLNPPLLR